MKTLKHTLFAAALIFAAASCTKESTGDTAPSAGVDVKAVFEAVAEDDMSKAILQSGVLQWEEDDQVAVYQYGKYNSSDNRDNTKNLFTSDGTCLFSGTIANYMPLDGGKQNRFYTVYPADRCEKYGIGTAEFTLAIPSTQTGSISDFDKYAMYLGFLYEDNTTVSYDADGETLTFLKPFELFCMTPVLKFNVPASLNVNKIVLTAQDSEGNAVNLAGTISAVRSDAGSAQPEFDKPVTAITVVNDDEILSGDVYVVLAPDSNTKVDGVQRSHFGSSAKALTLNLYNPQGATVALNLSLTGDVLAGTIKNLPSLPESVHWPLPVSPGFSAIEINKEAITSEDGTKTYDEKERILLTLEDPNSVIGYRTRSSLSDVIETTPNEPYTAVGIARQSANTPENYLKLRVSTESYADYNAYACTWIINKNYGFGKVISEDTSLTSDVIAVGSTYPTDGTYLYNLSFLYETKGATKFTPQINSDGFYIKRSSSNYWSGKLRIKVPGTGRGRLFFDCLLTDENATITVTRGEDTIATIVTANTADSRVVTSEFFDISAGDILAVSVTDNVRFDSITLLWEPEVTDTNLETESYSSKTSYGN